MQAIAKPNSQPGLIYFKDDFDTPPEEIFTVHKEAFGLGEDDSMYLFREKIVDSTKQIYAFKQFYKGKEVINKRANIHKFLNNSNMYLSYDLEPLLNIDLNINFDESEIVNELINHYNDNHYDTLNTNSIINKGIYVMPYENNHEFVYLLENIMDGDVFLLSVQNGDILHYGSHNGYETIKVYNSNFEENIDCFDVNVSVSEITSDNFTKYILSDTEIGTNINSYSQQIQIITPGFPNHPFPAETFREGNFIDYYENAGICPNSLDDNEDLVLAYLSTQTTYEYFLNNHSINSIDNNGSDLNIFVHSKQDYSNRYVLDALEMYKDGTFEMESFSNYVQVIQNQYSLGIVGHEWTHGVEKLLGDNLFQINEAGAIVEGVCDIMGYCIQQYFLEKYQLGDLDPQWLNQAGFSSYGNNPTANRSMKSPKDFLSPKSQKIFEPHPDFYGGDFWDTDGNHHHNATVLTHWFYLLAEGGNKISEDNIEFNINGVGLDIAAEIVMNAVTGWYFGYSGFGSMRLSTIHAAFELYEDICIVESVMNAWDAVGVYSNPNSFFEVYESNDVKYILNENFFTSNTNIENENNVYFEDFNVGIHNLGNISNSHITIVSSDIQFTDNNKIVIHENSTLEINDANISIGTGTQIIVKENGTLVINNSNLYFESNAEIIVEENGNIFIDNSDLKHDENAVYCGNSTFSDGCIYYPFMGTWNGISLETGGDISIENSTIKNAKTAVYINGHNVSESNILISTNDFEVNLISIYADCHINNNSSFSIINNNIVNPRNNEQVAYTDVICEPLWHHPLSSNITSMGSISFINVSNFDLIGNNFSLPQLPSNHPNFNNFGYAYTSAEPQIYDCEHSCRNSIGVYSYSELWEGTSYIIKDNTFNRWDKCIKIQAFGSEYIIENNTFDNFDFWALEANSNLEIIGNEFDTGREYGIRLLFASSVKLKDNDFNKVRKSIYGQGGTMSGIVVENNNIGVATSTQKDSYGIFFNGVPKFEIIENDFEVKNLTTGEFVSSSDVTNNQNSANVSNPNFYSYGAEIKNSGNFNDSYIFKNNISPVLDIGIQTEENNSKLRLKCNVFGQENNSGSSIAGLVHYSGELRNQGVNCQANENQAGNEWMNLCINNAPNNVLQPRRDIIINTDNGAEQFEYWAHAYNEDLIDNFTNQPKETTVPDCSNIAEGKLRVCDGNETNLDLKFKDSNSCQNMEAWKPNVVNDAIHGKITELLAIRNTEIVNLASLEAQLFDKDIQIELVKDIRESHSKIVAVNGDLVKLYYKIDDKISAINLLEADEKIESKFMLYHRYLDNKQFEDAERVLNEINVIYQEDYFFDNSEKEWRYQQNKDFMEYIAHLEKTMLSENKKWKDIEVSDKLALQNIVQADLPISPSAEVLLHWSGDTLVEHPIGKLSIEFMDELANETLSSDTFNYNLTITPNPANQQAEVCFTLPENSNNIQLKLIDAYNHIGMLLQAKQIQAGEICKTFNLSAYSTGTYRVILEIAGDPVSGKHLLIYK